MKKLLPFIFASTLLFVSCKMNNEYHVEFHSNYGSISKTFVLYEEGSLIEKPKTDKPYSVLIGWFVLSDFSGNHWDFENDRIYRNIDLYAKWDSLFVIENGSLKINTNSSVDTGSALKIPSFFDGERVTRLAESGFEDCLSIVSIELPIQIESIGSNCFKNSNNLKTINYEGTFDQWDRIQKGTNWNDTASNIKLICKDKSIILNKI